MATEVAGWRRFGSTPSEGLLGKREFDFARTGGVDWLGLRLHSFMPGDDVVLAIGNVVDLEVAVGISLGKVGCRAHDDVSRHLRVHVAQQRHHTWRVELERALFALRPRPKIVRFLFVPADGWPKDVV